MLGTRTLWRTSYGRPQHASVRTFFPEAKPKVYTPPPGPAAVSEVVEAGAPKVEKKARLHRRVLDHWKNFWLGIKTDYTEAVLDFKKDAQAKPVKSAILGAFAGFLLYCNQHNPDERSFHENFMDNGLELAQVRITYHGLIPSNSFLSLTTGWEWNTKSSQPTPPRLCGQGGQCWIAQASQPRSGEFENCLKIGCCCETSCHSFFFWKLVVVMPLFLLYSLPG